MNQFVESNTGVDIDLDFQAIGLMKEKASKKWKGQGLEETRVAQDKAEAKLAQRVLFLLN